MEGFACMMTRTFSDVRRMMYWQAGGHMTVPYAPWLVSEMSR